MLWFFSGEKNQSSAYAPASQTSGYSQPLYQPNASAYNTSTGYGCTEDCSGHDAGYAWAEEKGIDDPDDCGGNSDSFIEGCKEYAEEQQVASTDSEED